MCLVLQALSRWGGLGSKTVVSAKKATASIKNRIIPAIAALAEISLEETQESLPRGQVLQALVPKVRSRAEPCGQSLDTRVRSSMALVPGPNPEASFRIAAHLGGRQSFHRLLKIVRAFSCVAK
jgi:hypothetical protein